MSSQDYIINDFLTGDGAPSYPPSYQRQDAGRTSNRLIKQIKDLAPDHQSLYSSYNHFNEMQSAVFDSVYLSDESLVVGAPTASGKTTLLELAMLRLFSRYRQDKANIKAVYIAPLKALCTEKFLDWQQRFHSLGLRCCQFTGDSDTDIYRIATYNIILTTPEKLDASSRRWAQNKFFFDQIGLIMIDEIHTVGETRGRGGCLEALLTRCLTMSCRKQANRENCPASSMRFVALSATAPNVEEIGKWLHAKTFIFGDEYRPVPLQCHVIGYPMPPKASYFKFEGSLNFKVLDIIQQYASGKSALVFCSSRSGCYNCAKTIISSARQFGITFVNNHEQEQALYGLSCQLKDSSIKEIICNGIGIHNATLSSEDRTLIQEHFLKGNIHVLCATTTLAQGVNLPAHLVIIKGTQVYNKGNGNAEHPTATILQMIGRAGRPQFDDFGVAVILTTKNMVAHYKNLSGRQKAVESHLPENAIEHVNAEISLQTITSMNEAINWMNNTFASIRMATCPAQFGISAYEASNPESFLKVLARRMRHSIDSLAEAGMVVMKQNGRIIESTKLGSVMASYYLKLTTARSISELQPNASMEDILFMLCSSSEFLDLPIRQGEKKQLNAANKAGIRYQVKGKVKELADKISILLQTALESSTMNPFQTVLLNQDMRSSLDISQRVLQGAISYLGESKCHFSAYLNCFILQKALHMRMWSDSPQIIRQIEGIGPKKVVQLISSGITTIEKLRNISTAKIEALCERNPPFGLQVKQKLRQFPVLSIQIHLYDDSLRIEIQQTLPDFESRRSTSVNVLAGLSNERFLLCRKFQFENGVSTHNIELKDFLKLQASEVTVFAIFDSISGCDTSIRHYLDGHLRKLEIDSCTKPNDEICNRKERLSKHHRSLEEQSQIMRQNLTSCSKKKMRITTTATQGLPSKNHIIQKCAKSIGDVNVSLRSHSTPLKSNVGYNRAVLGIHSVCVENKSINQAEIPYSRGNHNESFRSRIEEDMKDIDDAIGTFSPLFIQQPAISIVDRTATFNNELDLDDYRQTKQDVAGTPPKPPAVSKKPLAFSQTASGQLAVEKTGGARLSQAVSLGTDLGRFSDFMMPKVCQIIPSNTDTSSLCKNAISGQTEITTQVNNFCDERLVFSSLFDD